MKRSQRARRISAREQARRRRQQREAQQAEQERQQQIVGQRAITAHDAAASSGRWRIPPDARGLLSGGDSQMTTRTQARGR